MDRTLRMKVCVAAVLFVALALAAAPTLAQCRIDMNPPLEVKVTWSYVSANSAALGVETTRAARTHVEYGPTPACDTKTSPTDPHFQHLHHLKGLTSEVTVHYRVVAVAEDGTRVMTRPGMLTPKTPDGAVVCVPDDMPQGPPYVLDKPNTTYLVTKDLVCAGKAFEIAASEVTLDLNGHTATYDSDEALERPQGAWNVMREQAPMGVRVRIRGKGIRILNGTIRQGAGNHAGTVPGVGYNPIFVSGATTEIAGIHAIWSGDDIGGFFLHGGDGHHVHHCVTEDKGSGIRNRHQAICNIGYAGTGEADHNLVKRSRHRAINALTNVHHNEVHVDSQATNAFGIDAPKGKPTEIHHNRIYGKGEHPIGIGATGNVKGLRVYANYVEVENSKGSTEYGNTGSACYRMTWGGEADDVEVYDNVFVLHAKRKAFVWQGKPMDSHGRAIWIGLPVKDEDPARTKPRVHFHHNTVIATNAGGGAKAAGIAIVCLNETPLLVFEENRVESNWANVLLSDSYGHSNGYPRFIGNTFVKVGDQESYATVRNAYTTRPANAEFIDNRYEGGASLERVSWTRPYEGQAKEIRVSHYLELTVRDAAGRAAADASVTVKDKDGLVVFEGKTDADGKVKAIVAERSVKPTGTTVLTPHTVTAAADGRTATETVTLDASKTEVLTLK